MADSTRPPGAEPFAWRALLRKISSSKSLRLAGIATIALLTVWMVTQGGADGSQIRPRQMVGTDPGWVRQASQDTSGVAEIRLDDLFDGANLDRRSVGGLAQTLVGNREPVDNMTVARFLDAVPRLRLTYGEMSIVLEREALGRVAQSLAGGDTPLETVRVGALLDTLPYLRVRAIVRRGWLAGRLQEVLSETEHDGPIVTALREIVGDIAPVALAHDARFGERRAMQLQYAAVVRIVKDIQRSAGGTIGPEVLYDQAFYRLVEEDRVDAVPLLDGHRRLQEEMASDRLDSMTRAERIADRWEARRRAFGPDVAALLFNREEAMERFEIDRLALEADPTLTDAERAGRLLDRRQGLKVELASQGTYVGFPAEAAGARRQP